MNRRKIAAAVAVLTLPLIAAHAGGWATITVAELPEYLIAQRPANLTFSVRQHGVELMRHTEPSIEARSGELVYRARAVPTNRAGYFTAKLDLPETGDWTVTIKSGHGRSNLTLLPIPVLSATARPVRLETAERGRHLFVAKGCVTCHVHDRLPGSGHVNVGPNLTDARFTVDYLERFLADPSVKTTWTGGERMPDLDLNAREIGALIAFLNSAPPQTQAAAPR